MNANTISPSAANLDIHFSGMREHLSEARLRMMAVAATMRTMDEAHHALLELTSDLYCLGNTVETLADSSSHVSAAEFLAQTKESLLAVLAFANSDEEYREPALALAESVYCLGLDVTAILDGMRTRQ